MCNLFIQNSLVLLFLVAGIFGFIPDNSLSLRVSQQLMSSFTLVLFIGLFLLDNVWVKMFMVWALIMSIFSAGGFGYSCGSLNILLIYLVGYQAFKNMITKDLMIKVINCICVIALIQVAMMILQKCGVWWIFKPKGTDTTFNYVCGFLGNPNLAGAFLAITLPLFFRKKIILLSPFLLVGLFLSQSMGGIVSACVGVIFYLFIKFDKKKFLIFSLILVLLLGGYVYLFEDLTSGYGSLIQGSSRFFHWGLIWKTMIVKEWITGWGLGQFKMIFPSIQLCGGVYEGINPNILNTFGKIPEWWVQAHNEYLQTWSEIGLIGLLIICGYFVSIFKRLEGIRVLLITGVVITLVNSGVHFLFHTTSAIVPLLYFGMLEGDKT